MKHETLPEKEDFFSYINMEDNSDADYTYGKRICNDFKICARFMANSLSALHDNLAEVMCIFLTTYLKPLNKTLSDHCIECSYSCKLHT